MRVNALMNKRWPSRKSKWSDKRRKGVKPFQFFRDDRNIQREEVSIVNKFWELIKSSVIVQGVVTLALVGTTCYLYATGTPVPESLLSLDGLVVGFFFGSKAQQVIQTRGK